MRSLQNAYRSSGSNDTTGEAIYAVVVLESSLAKGEAITQDTSTLDKPAIVDQSLNPNEHIKGAITP